MYIVRKGSGARSHGLQDVALQYSIHVAQSYAMGLISFIGNGRTHSSGAISSYDRVSSGATRGGLGGA
jgi:hypothetical protein